MNLTPKVLWAAIGVLALAVAGLGGALYSRDARQPASNAATTAAATTAPSASRLAQPMPLDGEPPARAASPVRAPETSAAAPTESAPAISQMPAPTAPAAAAPQTYPQAAPQPLASAAQPSTSAQPPPVRAPACRTCGHVESVRSVQRSQPATGVGAVAGGVVGSLVGNQIGNGNGRTAATVIGAVGGGLVGNEVEKRQRTVTRYQVAVRMDDGALGTVETGSAPPIGKAVTLKNGVLRPVDRKL